MYTLTNIHAAIIGRTERLDRSVWKGPDGFLAVRIAGHWHRLIDLELTCNVEISRA